MQLQLSRSSLGCYYDTFIGLSVQEKIDPWHHCQKLVPSGWDYY